MKTTINNKVAALDKVLGMCNALGASYNPSKASLKPTALKSLLELAQQKQQAVIVTRTAYAMAVNARAEAFAGIPALASQIARLANASTASPADREEVSMIRRKFYSVRKKKPSAITANAANGETVSKETRSSSKRDRLGMMETFEHLIQVVQSIPGYKPNEPEFKVEGLKAKLAELQSKSHAVASTSIALSSAMIARDQVLYSTDGVIDSTRDAMDYIRGRFGVRSPQSQKFSIQASQF